MRRCTRVHLLMQLKAGRLEHLSHAATGSNQCTQGTRTLGIYVIHAEPNIPIPDAIRNAAQKSSLPNLIKHLRKQVKR